MDMRLGIERINEALPKALVVDPVRVAVLALVSVSPVAVVSVGCPDEQVPLACSKSSAKTLLVHMLTRKALAVHVEVVIAAAQDGIRFPSSLAVNM